jgi:hypothetical protein
MSLPSRAESSLWSSKRNLLPFWALAFSLWVSRKPSLSLKLCESNFVSPGRLPGGPPWSWPWPASVMLWPGMMPAASCLLEEP